MSAAYLSATVCLVLGFCGGGDGVAVVVVVLLIVVAGKRWYRLGSWDSSVVERRTRDRKVSGSRPCRSSGRLFFSRVNFLCWLFFQYPFHPCVTAVARKRSQPFGQTCWWQVTAKHTCTLRMWLCIKWLVNCCVVEWCTQNGGISTWQQL